MEQEDWCFLTMSGGEEGSASVEVKKRKRKKGKKAKKREAGANEQIGLADSPAEVEDEVECGGDGAREDDEVDGDGSVVEDEANGEAKKRKVQTGLGIMSTVPFSSLNISELTMKAIGEMGFQNMTQVALASPAN